MISLELSSIQRNHTESARLAAATKEFLSRGGQILEAPSAIPAPHPYGYSAAPPLTQERKAPAPRRSKKTTMQSIRVVPDIEEAFAKQRKVELNNLDRVRELAKTMTQAEVTAETGLTRSQLYTISANNGFNFKTALKMDEITEAALVLRIRECMDKRMTRNKARLHLGISFSLLTRLIKTYDIPYPLAAC